MKKIVFLCISFFTFMFTACDKSVPSSVSTPVGNATFTNEEQELFKIYTNSLIKEIGEYIDLKNKVITSEVLEISGTIIKLMPDSGKEKIGDSVKIKIEKNEGLYYEEFYLNGTKEINEGTRGYFTLKGLLFGEFSDTYEEILTFITNLNNSGKLKKLKLSLNDTKTDECTVYFMFFTENKNIYIDYKITKDGYSAIINLNEEELKADTIQELNILVREYLLNWELNQI